jgi:hypothetical protein
MPAHTRFRTWSLFSSNVVSLGCHRDIYFRVDLFLYGLFWVPSVGRTRRQLWGMIAYYLAR